MILPEPSNTGVLHGLVEHTFVWSYSAFKGYYQPTTLVFISNSHIHGRHERHPWSQQLKSRFDSLEDLDHPLPLDLRSTSMRWLVVVDGEKISLEIAVRLQEDEEVANRTCFSGFCADFKSHSQLSEKAKVEAKSIVENRFTRVSKVVDLRLLKEIRSPVLNGIVNALKDDNLNIQGMGVVGKMNLLHFFKLPCIKLLMKDLNIHQSLSPMCWLMA
ncbi:hypothetical protein V6N11_069527 [Hibiscus sabdariffa]|uniref:Uncharacterized protein n=1 Tax=Hibiscus sabdariffa TaxID=183260 RepID=A0ABR2Q307_9ROSI